MIHILEENSSDLTTKVLGLDIAGGQVVQILFSLKCTIQIFHLVVPGGGAADFGSVSIWSKIPIRFLAWLCLEAPGLPDWFKQGTKTLPSPFSGAWLEQGMQPII